MALTNFTDHFTTLDVPAFVNYLTVVIGLAGTCFNLLIVYAYTTEREIRNLPENFFIFCLSISDGLTGTSLLIHFIWVKNGAIIPASYNVPCLLWGSLTYTSVLSSAFLIILISWDRLQMVTHPFKHRQFTQRRAVLQVAVLWMIVLLYVAISAFLHSGFSSVLYNEETKLIPCIISSVDDLYVYVSIVLDAVIPLIILVIIHVLIGIRIRRVTVARIETQRLNTNHEATSTLTDADTGNEIVTISSVVSNKTNQTERKTNFEKATETSSKSSRTVYVKMRKTVRILFLFVIVYISCWLPLYIGLITDISIDVEPWVLHFLFIVGGINPVINPFIYAFMSNKYRKRLTLILRCRVR